MASSEEAIWSGSTLFAKVEVIVFSRIRVKALCKICSRWQSKNFYICCLFFRQTVLTFLVNGLPSRPFTRNVKTCFLWKIEKIKMLSATVVRELYGLNGWLYRSIWLTFLSPIRGNGYYLMVCVCVCVWEWGGGWSGAELFCLSHLKMDLL